MNLRDIILGGFSPAPTWVKKLVGIETRRVSSLAVKRGDEVLVSTRYLDQPACDPYQLWILGKPSAKIYPDENWGFADQFGKFLTREEAIHIAKKEGQLPRTAK